MEHRLTPEAEADLDDLWYYVASLVGLVPAPYQSGDTAHDLINSQGSRSRWHGTRHGTACSGALEATASFW